MRDGKNDVSVVTRAPSLDNEGDGVWRHLLHALLDDMVAVHAFDARHDVLLQLLGHQQLRLARHVLDRLLHDAATVRLVRQHEQLREEHLRVCVSGGGPTHAGV